MIRVFLVDDHTVVRAGLRLLLTAQPDIEVVGEAGNGQELLAQFPAIPPDIVLLDINMPSMNGPETAHQLRKQHPEVRILALSMLDKEAYIHQMLDAGAQGYVLKSAGTEEILAGIRTVASGGQFLCTAAGLAALQKLREGTAMPSANDQKKGSLSQREIEVLQCISQGLTTNEIADKLFLSRRTIETHRQNMLEKTQTKNTAALIKMGVSEGIIS
jgi:DNA-binding NarL/FixJ family response regulator